MVYKSLTAVPLICIVGACSGGSSGTAIGGGTTANAQQTAELLTIPTESEKVVEISSIEELEKEINNLAEGDTFSLPMEEIDEPGAQGTITATIGPKNESGTTLVATIDNGDGATVRNFSVQSDLAVITSEYTEPQDLTDNFEKYEINGTQIYIYAASGDDFQELNASAELSDGSVLAEAKARQFVLNGSDIKRVSVDGSGKFNKPTGKFDYTGKAVVAWSKNEAIGDVTMSTDFDTNSGSIEAASLTSPGDKAATASFGGNIGIDSATGHYTSTNANLTINGQRYDAGIVGTFSGDAKQSAGTVFDANTLGDTAVGTFAVAQDPAN